MDEKRILIVSFVALAQVKIRAVVVLRLKKNYHAQSNRGDFEIIKMMHYNNLRYTWKNLVMIVECEH